MSSFKFEKLYLDFCSNREVKNLQQTRRFRVFLYKVAYMKFLKVQPCKFYNNKFIMIASTKITNTDIFEFIAVLVFKLFSSKFLFINRKENRNC